jgi:PilZ domain
MTVFQSFSRLTCRGIECPDRRLVTRVCTSSGGLALSWCELRKIVRGGVLMFKAVANASRRCESRIEISDGVWIIWRCGGREMVSTVENISPGGLFAECASPRPFGATVEVYFLVPEGKIAGEAVVKHSQTGRGIGLRFTRILETDRMRMVGLIRRLRSASLEPNSQSRRGW